jgi:hypothetical protein
VDEMLESAERANVVADIAWRFKLNLMRKRVER